MPQGLPYFRREQPRMVDQRLRIATVSYLEARPLTAGLADSHDVSLTSGAPADMLQRLHWDQSDVALLPTIDLQRSEDPLVILPVGCVASAGATMTMRLYSRVRPEKIKLLWADTEARTVTVLARLLWSQNYRRDLEVIPLQAEGKPLPEDAEAVLLVGDRVAGAAPAGFEWQLDLGALWFELTGVPFVYAIWAAREDSNYAAAYAMLLESRKRGQHELEEIARRYGPDAGWPAELAIKHLMRNVQYEVTPAHLDGIEEFFDRADEAGLLPEYRPLHFYQP